MSMTVAEAMAAAFKRHGVRHVFGVPGGGSSLDIIRACEAEGIGFVVTRSESAGVMMAGASAELSGGIGVALTTKGPGTANAANGVAYASLDRAPVLVLTDGFTPKQMGYVTHQVFDQQAMLAPVVKGHSRLPEGSAAEIEALIALALAEPRGPVHLELTGEEVRRVCRPAAAAPASVPAKVDVAAVAERVAAAKRPVLVLGLEARSAPAEIAMLQAALGCPVLATYKAKGVVPDAHPAMVGLFTGGAVEAECVAAADLIVLVGLDPVELILQPWSYAADVVELATHVRPVHYVRAGALAVGPMPELVTALVAGVAGFRTGWAAAEIAGFKRGMRDKLGYVGQGEGLTPVEVVSLAVEAAEGMRARISVDAGAHMFSAMAFWQSAAAREVLISNGLATMAFALPAAIAAALDDPSRPVVAFTGDGGLMMCLGELATAAQVGARIRVVVFNDAGLSLIGIKQRSRNLPEEGVTWPDSDFAAVARGFGFTAFKVADTAGYRAALAAALAAEGPALIDVRVDPSGYPEQLKAMRG